MLLPSVLELLYIKCLLMLFYLQGTEVIFSIAELLIRQVREIEPTGCIEREKDFFKESVHMVVVM